MLRRTLFLPLVVLSVLVGCPPADDDDSTPVGDDDDSTPVGDDDDSTPVGDDDDDSAATVQPVGDWTAIACSTSAVCALDESGRPFCLFSQATEMTPGPSDGFVEISTTAGDACALDAFGMGTCWNSVGSPSPGIPQEPLYSLQASCALRQSDGLPTCWWGSSMATPPGPWDQLYQRFPGSFGCLRDSAGVTCRIYASTFQLGLVGAYIDMVSDSDFLCAIDTAGAIVCIGDNVEGVLDAPSGTGWIGLSGHNRSPCAWKADGTTECWGRMEGYGPPEPMRTVCDHWGDAFTCGISTSNNIRCWGPIPPANLVQFY